MSRRSYSNGRPHRSFADDYPLPSQDPREPQDLRPRPAPLPPPPMTPNAPRAGSHLQQLLHATGVQPYETRMIAPTGHAYRPSSPPYQPTSSSYQRPEPSPLSNGYRTRTIEPESRANVDTDHDFDRFIDTDDLEEADLPGLPGSLNTRSYTRPTPSSLSRLQNVLEHQEGPRGPPPSPTFTPTTPPYVPVGNWSTVHDRAPGRDLEQEMEASIAGPRLQFDPADTNVEGNGFGDRLAGNDNEALRLADHLLRQATELETRIRNRGRMTPAAEQAVRTATESARALLQSLANPAPQPPGPGIFIDALPTRKITVADQGEDGHATCSICHEQIDIGTTVTHLSCRHWFCTDCLEPWLHNRTCPTCRAPINA